MQIIPIKEKPVSTTIMTKINVALPTFLTATSFVTSKNVRMNTANSLITNSNNCTIPIDTKPNSVNITPKILRNVTTKIFVHLPILKMKSSKTSSSFTYSKKLMTSIFISIRPYGVHLPKSIFSINQPLT